jgi:hypothetical protein
MQASGWEGITVDTLCLEVEQSYPGIEAKSPEPIAEAAQGILAGLGIQITDERTSCDATLTLALTGEARAGEYIGSGECHSGAQVTGEMILAAPGRVPLTVSVRGFYPPPFRIVGCPGPIDAPFDHAWMEALLVGLAHLWGPQVLFHALEDETFWVREIATEALGEIGPEEGVVPALIHALEDSSGDVAEAAAEALGEIGPKAAEAVPALIQALEDGRSAVRHDAASALGKIGPQAVEAVPALIRALEDESRLVCISAAQALKGITRQDFGEDAAAWQEWWEEHQ